MQNKKIVFEKIKKEISDIIQNLNSTTLCFTGHRSQKLPWGFNEKDVRCQTMKITLRGEIEKAIQKGYNTFLCGMALGFDMICAETVLDLKKKYSQIKLIGALPCKTQDVKWRENDRKRYKKNFKTFRRYPLHLRRIYRGRVYVGAKQIYGK